MLPCQIWSFNAEGCKNKYTETEYWGVLELGLLGMGGAAGSTKLAPSLMCYLAEHGHSALKDADINRREPQ